jgi:hypothetical protein
MLTLLVELKKIGVLLTAVVARAEMIDFFIEKQPMMLKD